MTSLLLVEDDERISQPLVQLLTNEGFTVQHVDRGELATKIERRPRQAKLERRLLERWEA